MAANLQVLLDNRPTGKVSPANFVVSKPRLRRRGRGRFWCAISSCRSTPICAAGSATRNPTLLPRRSARLWAAARSALLRPPTIPASRPGDAVVGMGGWQRYRVERRARPERGRRQGDPDPGLPRPAWHARRNRLVRPQQDHRAEGRRDRAGVGRDRRGRFRGRPTRQRCGRARRRDRRAVRTNAPMPSRSSATPPASITSRREFAEELKAALPGGVDGLFENVGGEPFAQALRRLNNFARVAICGLIASYEGAPTALPDMRDFPGQAVSGWRGSSSRTIWTCGRRRLANWSAMSPPDA